MPGLYETLFLVSGKTCEAGSSVDGAGKREFKCVSGRAGMLGVLLLLKYSGSIRQRDDREGAEEDSCFVSRRNQDPGCQKTPAVLRVPSRGSREAALLQLRKGGARNLLHLATSSLYLLNIWTSI